MGEAEVGENVRASTAVASCALAFVIALTSCGSLVEDGYLGEPLFEIEANVEDFRDILNSQEEIQTSLFWSSVGDSSTDVGDLQTEAVTALRLLPPSTMQIRVHDRPDLDATRAYEVGQIIMWFDEDKNGRLDEGETRGGADEKVVLFAKRTLTAAESPTGFALNPGFAILPTNLECELDETPPGEDCGVELGRACSGDEDCGLGQCIDTDGNLNFPGGYCVLGGDVACTPVGAAVHGISTEEGGNYVWVKGCSRDEECRVDEDYACSLGTRACLPKEPLQILLLSELEIDSLCYQGP